MEDKRLEEVIRQYIQLAPTPNARGFYPVLCKVCMDHGKKGKRAGFKFEGDSVGYNCFNCGHTAKYDPDNHATMSQNMVTVLDSFHVPDDEYKQVLLASLARSNRISNSDNPKQIYTKIEPDVIQLPEHFYPLGDANSEDKWDIIARDYLETDRGIDPDKHKFYLSKGGNDYQSNKWKGRVIIPVYKDEKLIFYQGRALVSATRKYESPDIAKDKVLYGFNRLFEPTELPLYVDEGWFDAEVMGGVATFGNRLTDAQIRWLNRSRRPKVVIPDKFGDGNVMAEQAIDEGWYVSTPDVGNCKDMNAAVKRFGKLYVMNTVAEQTRKGFGARTAIGIYCEQNTSTQKNKNTRPRKGGKL